MNNKELKGGKMRKENKAIIITSIISVAVVIIALVAIFASSPSKNTVTVEGIATIDANPDLLTVYFNIETIKDTSAEAKDANDEILDDLVVELINLGFAREELQTQGFNIYPNYEYNNGKQTQKGYRATHSLKLELSSEEFDKVSSVIDAGANSGAGINYINFELSPDLQNQYKAQALELASKDAKIKAEAVADGFGKNIGRLVSVQISDFGYYPWNIYTSRMDSAVSFGAEEAAIAKDATMNIVPGDQEVNARVSATFKIF